MWLTRIAHPLQLISIQAYGDTMYVTAPTINVRLASNSTGQITNKTSITQSVTVYETSNNWSWISKYYSGSLEGMNGEIARWVHSDYLSDNKPTANTNHKNSQLEKTISYSDDFNKYKSIFVKISESLIRLGRCKIKDFERMGGWIRSTNYKPRKVYFTYCGAMTSANKVYLDVNTKRIF